MVVVLVVMIVVAGYLNYQTQKGDESAKNAEESVYSTEQLSDAAVDDSDVTADACTHWRIQLPVLLQPHVVLRVRHFQAICIFSDRQWV